VIDALQVIEHIDAGDTTQEIKAKLVAQETTHSYQVRPIYFQAQIIALQGLRLNCLAGNLSNRSQVARERGILVAIAPTRS
jgi:hypothetical protein